MSTMGQVGGGGTSSEDWAVCVPISRFSSANFFKPPSNLIKDSRYLSNVTRWISMSSFTSAISTDKHLHSVHSLSAPCCPCKGWFEVDDGSSSQTSLQLLCNRVYIYIYIFIYIINGLLTRGIGKFGPGI